MRELAPQFLGAFAPLLVMVVCPVSMLLMMRSTQRHRDAPSGPAHDERQVRELEEEVNRLQAN